KSAPRKLLVCASPRTPGPVRSVTPSRPLPTCAWARSRPPPRQASRSSARHGTCTPGRCLAKSLSWLWGSRRSGHLWQATSWTKPGNSSPRGSLPSTEVSQLARDHHLERLGQPAFRQPGRSSVVCDALTQPIRKDIRISDLTGMRLDSHHLAVERV